MASEELWAAFLRARERLIEIVRERSFRKGTFTLASGKSSTRYFDMRSTSTHPEGSYICALGVLGIIQSLRAQGVEVDYVAGVATGGIPLASVTAVLSHLHGVPVQSLIIRKEVKEHGTGKWIEGLAGSDVFIGKRVVVVEDTTTTGGSVMRPVEGLRKAGAIVEHVIVSLDREEGARERCEAGGRELHTLLVAADVDPEDDVPDDSWSD